MAFRVVPLGSVGPRDGNYAVPVLRGQSRSHSESHLLRPTRYFIKPKPLLAGWFEALVYGLCVFRTDRYFLVLLSEFLVHERDSVVAGR